MIRCALLVTLLIVTGCSNNIAGDNCGDVAREAIGISKGVLVTIDKRILTSKDDRRLVCHGTGFYRNGSEIPIRFQEFVDEDGRTIVRWDTDEYQASEELRAKRESQQDENQEDQRAQRDWDQAMSDARFQAQVDQPDSTPIE